MMLHAAEEKEDVDKFSPLSKLGNNSLGCFAVDRCPIRSVSLADASASSVSAANSYFVMMGTLWNDDYFGTRICSLSLLVISFF